MLPNAAGEDGVGDAVTSGGGRQAAFVRLIAERLGLIDEYHLVVHPVLAGHGPSLFQGLERSRHLHLVSTTSLKSGVTAMHYRRKEG